MRLKAYRDGRFHCIKARDLAVFRADHKYVMGITPDGTEWLLPDGITLKTIGTVLSDLVRINRGVLVKSQHLIGMYRTRCKTNYSVTVQTTVGDYRLARRNCVKSVQAVIEKNITRGTRPYTQPTDKAV